MIDFGLARARSRGTGTDTVGFTDGYAAPEQYEPNCTCDPRLDVYSLGTLLYFLLTAADPPKAIERLQGGACTGLRECRRGSGRGWSRPWR